MAEYIERQKAIDALRNAENHAFNAYYKGLVRAHKIIAELPSARPELESADVEKVCRCKDCKYRDSDDFCVGRGFPYQLVAGDEFCSRAKTKEHIND